MVRSGSLIALLESFLKSINLRILFHFKLMEFNERKKKKTVKKRWSKP